MRRNFPAPQTRAVSAIDRPTVLQVLWIHQLAVTTKPGREERLEAVPPGARREETLRRQHRRQPGHTGIGLAERLDFELLVVEEKASDHRLVLFGLARAGRVDQ